MNQKQISPQSALVDIEELLLFSLQSEPTANITELQDVLKREKERIETLNIERRRQDVESRITDFLDPPASSSTRYL